MRLVCLRFTGQALAWTDIEIMAYAAEHGHDVLTHDLDFSAIRTSEPRSTGAAPPELIGGERGTRTLDLGIMSATL